MKTALVAGIAAIALAFIVLFYFNYGGAFIPRGIATSNGQLIYTRGVDNSGVRITYSGGPPTMGMMGISCINCHGADGKGGYYPMMCNTISADLRYSSLIAAGYTNSTIKIAITEGLDESGDSLSNCMPRWSMSSSDLNDLVSYLAQLG